MQTVKHIQAISLAVLLLSGCADHTPEKAVEAQTIAQQACTALYAKNPQAVGNLDDCYMWVANSLYNGKTLSMLSQDVQLYKEGACTGGALKRNTERWKSCVAESKLTLAGIDTVLQGEPQTAAQQPIPKTQPTPPPQSGYARLQQQQCLAEGLKQGTAEYTTCLAEVQKNWGNTQDKSVCANAPDFDKCMRYEYERVGEHYSSGTMQPPIASYHAPEPKTKCEEYGLKKGTIDYANCMIIQDQITEQAKQREQMMVMEAEMQQRASERESNNAMMGLGIGLLTGSIGAPPPPPPLMQQTHCQSYMVGQRLMTDCR